MVQNQGASDEMGEEGDEMDDITFCMSDCQRTDCYRHPSNIQDRTIPHSYAYFRETDTCPSRQLIEKMQLSGEDATKDATVDCISRQQAILAIDRNAYRHTYIDQIVDIIKCLPSVQSEIIRCKDCKWCEDAEGLICKNTASWVVATDYDFGCVCAERRQDG